MATEIVEPTIHEHEPTRNPIVVPKVQPTKSEDVTPSSAPNTESTTPKHNTISSEDDFSAPDLGQPSRNLHVDDFELIKTLGTGMSCQSDGSDTIAIGTDLLVTRNLCACLAYAPQEQSQERQCLCFKSPPQSRWYVNGFAPRLGCINLVA